MAVLQPFPSQSISDRFQDEMAEEVRLGLTNPNQKELPSKYFYDEMGSELFEAICLLPEYGLSRAGARLMKRHAEELVQRLDLSVMVAELGSGTGTNTRWLLQSLARRQAVRYFPIDISPLALSRCRQQLGSLDSVVLVGLERSYLDGLRHVVARRKQNERILVLFLGSTIGNFERAAGTAFLSDIQRILWPGDALLLAADLEKPVEQLVAAYDDSLGVTAAFNLNLLARINRELGADFDLKKFRHEAIWNETERRIEMHLRSQEAQRVSIPGAGITVEFKRCETIWTESSHKYAPTEIVEMARSTGYGCVAQWIDEEWPFAHSLFVAKPAN